MNTTETVITACAWAAAGVGFGLVVTALQSPTGRPRRYRPRHRRPWWPWRPRAAAVFVGVTLDSPPLADVMPAPEPEPEHMSLAAVLEEVTDEHLHHDLELAAIRAEVRAELAVRWTVVEDAVIVDRMATAAALARWQRTTPATYDRSAARQRTLVDLFDEVTEAWDVRELRKLVGAA